MSSKSDQTEVMFRPTFSRKVKDEVLSAGGWGQARLSMRFGFPDPALFPYEELAAATARVMSDPKMGERALQYGGSRGLPTLVGFLAGKLNEGEDLGLEPENLIIAGGSSGVIGLAARAFLDEGDAVLVESPTFPGAVGIFRRAGAKIIDVPTGPAGIDVAGTESVLGSLWEQGIRPRILYTMPTFHNPTGLTLPEAERLALLDMARRFDLVVLEDDAYHDLYYDTEGGPLPSSLYALDTDGRVIRTGTFSKILAPGMRLGWGMAQPEIISRMVLLKEEGGTSPFAQQVAYEFSRDGQLAAYIDRLVPAYRAKRDAMLAALERHFPREAAWTRPAGGFFVWVTLPQNIDPDRLRDRAEREEVDYMLGSRCFAESPSGAPHYMRLSFSSLSEGDIEEAISRLGRVLLSIL